jgi:ribosomal protein S18 acetylase RimI-like enzyme
MTEPDVRRATLADAAAVARLTEAAYAKYVPILGRKPQPMTTDHARLIAEHTVWLLWAEDRLVGVLELIDEPGVLLIYSIAIDPGQQRQGHGGQLLAWAETQARANGQQRIRLYTNERMSSNVAWYTAHGFVETGREPVQGSALVHMSKTLAP